MQLALTPYFRCDKLITQGSVLVVCYTIIICVLCHHYLCVMPSLSVCYVIIICVLRHHYLCVMPSLSVCYAIINLCVMSSLSVCYIIIICVLHHHYLCVITSLSVFYNIITRIIDWFHDWLYHNHVYRCSLEIFIHMETSSMPVMSSRIYTYAWHLWCLSSAGSISCHTYCEIGPWFLCLIRRTISFRFLLWQVWGFWGPILTLYPRGLENRKSSGIPCRTEDKGSPKSWTYFEAPYWRIST
jgi:hypothetical protein